MSGHSTPEALEGSLDSIEDVFNVFTPDGSFVGWNETFTPVTGYTAEEISNLNPTDLVADAKRKDMNVPLNNGTWDSTVGTFANVDKINVKVSGPGWAKFFVRSGVNGGNPGDSVGTRDWDPSFTFAIFSDGVATGWEWQDIWEDEPKSVGTIANRLIEHHGKWDDDAPALVVTKTNG